MLAEPGAISSSWFAGYTLVADGTNHAWQLRSRALVDNSSQDSMSDQLDQYLLRPQLD